MTFVKVSACVEALVHSADVKAACALITTIIFSATGTNFVLYEAVFIAWMIGLALGFLLDIKDRRHPFQNFAGGFTYIFAYICLILVTHQIVRIYEWMSPLETLTAAYCATNEILKVHGHAKQLGFTMLDPLTKHITKYLDNVTNNGGKT